jgi:hypothetical protein
MPSISTWTFTLDDLTANANQVKDLIANKLNLPELDDYAIVVQKPSAMGRFSKWLGFSKEDTNRDLAALFIVRKIEKEKET